MLVKGLQWSHDPNFDENTICAHFFSVADINVDFVISEYKYFKENEVDIHYELALYQELRRTEVAICLNNFKTIQEAKNYAEKYKHDFLNNFIKVAQ